MVGHYNRSRVPVGRVTNTCLTMQVAARPLTASTPLPPDAAGERAAKNFVAGSEGNSRAREKRPSSAIRSVRKPTPSTVVYCLGSLVFRTAFRPVAERFDGLVRRYWSAFAFLRRALDNPQLPTVRPRNRINCYRTARRSSQAFTTF